LPSVLCCSCVLLACTTKPRPAEEPAPLPAAKAAPEAKRSAIQPRDPAPQPGAFPETVDGYRVVRARTKDGQSASVRLKAPEGWEIVQPPTEPDPHGGKFTLAQATKGLAKQGTLAVHIKTSMGSFYCDLLSEEAPNTVANFVGLARGLRKFWDTEALAWTARPYYDGTTFHRVIPGFMIQGGDHTGTGRGFLGYQIPDELSGKLRHDRPGLLCMANQRPNTGASQFFITEVPAPHLAGGYSIFGQCEPATLVQRIARVPQAAGSNNRPLTPVTIERVEVRKVVGGAKKWMPASAKLPPLPGLPAPGRAVEVPE
jgi:peptidyl-prolyl cis-trans isomerase A (cyclophilin A)